MRLGDLDKAEAVLRNIADHLKEDGCEDLLWASAYTEADVIKKQRTIDAVPVVRCKDCKHYYVDECYGATTCDRDCLDEPDVSDFCSYGERKDGDG